METKLLRGDISVDDRGKVRFINDFDFSGVKRFYQVENHSRGFIRAWHGHTRESKYVYVASGSALVGTIDMNFEEGHEHPQKQVLSAAKPSVLWIPPGYANGFKNLEEGTIVIFFSTSTLEESKGDDIRINYKRWDIWEEDYR